MFEVRVPQNAPRVRKGCPKGSKKGPKSQGERSVEAYFLAFLFKKAPSLHPEWPRDENNCQKGSNGLPNRPQNATQNPILGRAPWGLIFGPDKNRGSFPLSANVFSLVLQAEYPEVVSPSIRTFPSIQSFLHILHLHNPCINATKRHKSNKKCYQLRALGSLATCPIELNDGCRLKCHP